MKKILAALLACLSVFSFALLPFSAGAEERLSIICSTFPQYDWTRQILGERAQEVELTLLLDNGADLHNYQPSAADILCLSGGDLFIYVGGESDAWAEDVLAAARNPDLTTLALLDCVAAKAEETVEGMQADEHEEDHGEAEYDEHVWLSLRNAAILTERIAEALCSLDGENAQLYRANAAAYIDSLNALDEQYQAAVAAGGRDTILFADRFPFRYLAEDYGLNYYAAFSGCAAETEASFETIAFLARKVDELGLNAVLTLEGADHAIAETVVASTQAKNQQILQMDSMQSITAADVEGGANYLEIMTKNLEALELALN